jgi:hypothetical protein
VLATTSPGPGVIVNPAGPVPAGVSQARLRATLGGGQVRVMSGAPGLYQAELRSPSAPSLQTATNGQLAVVDLRAPNQRGLIARNRGSDWTVRLSTALPWRLDLEGGALTTDLDLRQLDVREVHVDTGISRLAIRLGEPAATVPVNVQVTAGLVDLDLPRSVDCTVRVVGLALADVSGQGLVKQGDEWRTPNLPSPRRYDIVVRASAGARVRLRRR